MNFYTILIVFISGQSINAARILGIFGFPGPAQYAFVEPLLKELARRGHHVTAITSFPQKEPIENFRDIVISANINLFDEYRNFTMENIDANHYDIVDGIYNKAYEMCENILNNRAVIDLKANESFDIILLDLIFSESLFGLSQHFKAPMVGISSMGTMTSVDELVGNTTPLSYIPNIIMTRPYNQNMNFWRRCLNVTLYLSEWVYYYYKYFPMQQRIYEHYFPNATLSFGEAQKNFSLVLVNDHFTISTPRPYVSNMIEVAGMHIPRDPAPIPGHIKELLNGAKQGVIYVTMNTRLPEYIMDMMLLQFKNLPQLVLWNTPYIPSAHQEVTSNVYFTTNVCHHSVLQHPHIYLIISHGGYLGLIDSIHYGIPILGIPNITGQQDDNVEYIRKIGNGLSLSTNRINSDSLAIALHDLLATDRYRREAKLRSQQFRDQQNTPMERAVYWIEYVLRHKGAVHLRNLGQNLTIWQFYNLDVFLSIGLVIIAVICLSYICLKIVIKLLMKYYLGKYKSE